MQFPAHFPIASAQSNPLTTLPLLLASQHRQQSTIVDSKPTPLSTITHLVTTTTQSPTTLTTLQHTYTQITLTLIIASEHTKLPIPFLISLAHITIVIERL